MSNDSSTGGYLVPLGPDEAEDAALAAILQGAVAGITGLAGNLVRPRWQALPPQQPPLTTNWAAIGATQTDPTDYPYFNDAGHLDRQERLTVMASFYGPNAGTYGARLRDGLYVKQNLDVLYANGIKLYEAGTLVTVPELIGDTWVMRRDLTVLLMRDIERAYAIKPIIDGPTHTMVDNLIVLDGTVAPNLCDQSGNAILTQDGYLIGLVVYPYPPSSP